MANSKSFSRSYEKLADRAWSPLRDLCQQRFPWIVAILVLSYLAIELRYICTLPMVMDEYQFASEVERLRDRVPYRDFRPYKNLLGYYLQAAPQALGQALGNSAWSGLVAVKGTLAATVTIALAWAAFALRSIFSRQALCVSLLGLVCMSTFLERSAAFRVDMLASLLGFVSLLSLLRGRALIAGLLVGASFLATQKGIYFALAGGLALTASWLSDLRAPHRIRRVAFFALGAAAAPALYAAVFSAFSSPDRVLHAMFVSPKGVAIGDLYHIHHYWWQTLVRNPFFYSMAALGLLQLGLRRALPTRPEERVVLLVYASALVVLCALHRQPWPYFFVMLIPTLFVLVAALLDSREPGDKGHASLVEQPALMLVAIVGLALPLARIPTVLARDNGLQRHTTELAAAILEPGDTYVAGLNMLYTHPMQPRDMRWLDRPRLRELRRTSDEDLHQVLERLRAAPIKLVIQTYRLDKLPDPLAAFFEENFLPIHGRIAIYAPSMGPSQGVIDLEFSGPYALVADEETSLSIDGRTMRPGQALPLVRGEHRYECSGTCRLQLTPEAVGDLADARYASNDRLFHRAYDY